MEGTFLLVLVIVGVVMVVVAIALGRYPGKVAARRNHPNKDAIMIAGQLGILTFGLLWVAALVWAHSNFTTTGMTQVDFRPCPSCKELISAKAITCKHCGAQLNAAMSPPQLAQPVASSTGVADEIEKLAKLRDQGILTQAEFDARKKSVLGL